MTTGRAGRPDCVDAETLAAFVDGRLSAAERAQVEAHVADCEECREALVEVGLTSESLSKPVTARLTRGFPARRWQAGIALAAAVVLAVIWIRPFGLAFTVNQRTADAVALLATGLRTERPTPGRLEGPFPWAPVRSVQRGTPGSPRAPELDEALGRLHRLIAEQPNVRTLTAAGLADLAVDNLDPSIAEFESALKLDPKDPAARTDLSAALLERWRQAGDHADAVRALDQAEQAIDTSPPGVSALFNRAAAYEALGMSAAAATAWQSYLAADPSSPWAAEAREHVKHLHGQSRLEQFSPKDMPPDDMRRWARENAAPIYGYLERDALPAWAKAVLHDEQPTIIPLGQMTAALRLAGRDTYATDLVDSVESSSAWSATRRRCLAEAVLAMARSRSLYDGSDYRAAADAASVASTAFRCAGTTTLDADMQLAWSVFFDNERERGLQLAARALPEAGRRRYLRIQGRYFYMLGMWDLGIGQMSAALEAYASADSAYRAAADVSQDSALEVLVAEAYRVQGDPVATWQHLSAALSHLDSGLSPRLQYMVLSNAQATASLDGYFAAAVAFTRELVDVGRVWDQPVARIDPLVLEAGHLTRVGLTSDAVAMLAVARHRLDALPDAGTRSQYEGQIAWMEGLALQQSNPAASVRALTTAYDSFKRRNLPFLLADVLLARGRAYRATGNPAEAERDWTEGTRILDDQRPGIRDDQLKISRADQLWALYSELIDITSDRPVRALSVAEHQRARALLDSLDRGQKPPLVDPPALYDWLPEDTTVLAYAALPTQLLIWEVRREGVRLNRRPVTADQLADVVSGATDDFRKGDTSALDHLAALVLPSDLKLTPEARLVILPDGPLYRVPFAALRHPATGHLLIDDAVPVVSPSLSVLKIWARPVRRTTASALLIGVGGGQPTLGLSPLPGVQEEIAQLVRLYPRATVLSGAAATPTAVLRALDGMSVVHFAGHALMNDLYPARAQLLMAPEQTRTGVTPSDISAHTLAPGALVVLSACDTAVGKTYRGEGAMSLARPFLRAGASSVVGTLWPVRDEPSHALLVAFHRNVAAGLPASVALAQAQRAARAVGRDADWAAFVLIGSES
jgi:CHAT domain-containing protein/tetratricopeptide (TPR) repeat protein